LATSSVQLRYGHYLDSIYNVSCMYVALINVRITNTNSKTVTIYEYMVRSE